MKLCSASISAIGAYSFSNTKIELNFLQFNLKTEYTAIDIRNWSLKFRVIISFSNAKTEKTQYIFFPWCSINNFQFKVVRVFFASVISFANNQVPSLRQHLKLINCSVALRFSLWNLKTFHTRFRLVNRLYCAKKNNFIAFGNATNLMNHTAW